MFSHQVTRLQFTKDIHFGDEAEIWIPKSGDVVKGTMYLRVQWPAGFTGVDDSTGTRMLDYVELMYNNQLIERHYGETIELTNDLTVPLAKQQVLTSTLGKNLTSNLSVYYIRLPFSVDLPLCALEHHATLRIKFRDLQEFAYSTYSGIIKVDLFVDYIYLTSKEVEAFKKNTYDYLCKNFQYIEFHVSAGIIQQTISTEFVNSVNELYWIIQTDGAPAYDYTNDGSDQLVSLQLVFNEDDIIPIELGTPLYLNSTIPLTYHQRIPTRKFYMYCFAIDPESTQPTGQINLSKIKNQLHKLTLSPCDFSRSIRIYAQTRTVVRIKGGALHVITDMLREAGTINNNYTFKNRYPGLYYFNSFTFTTLGTSGYKGPSNNYSDKKKITLFTCIQKWFVPATGTYRILAAGAYGAASGRVVQGDVILVQGQNLNLLVGQLPSLISTSDNISVGGGGGTYIMSDKTPLIVAAGGDGGSTYSAISQPAQGYNNSGSGAGLSGAGYYSKGMTTDITFPYPIGNGNQYLYGFQGSGGFGGGQAPLPYGFEMPASQITAASMYIFEVANNPSSYVRPGHILTCAPVSGTITVTSVTSSNITASFSTPFSGNIPVGTTVNDYTPTISYSNYITVGYSNLYITVIGNASTIPRGSFIGLSTVPSIVGTVNSAIYDAVNLVTYILVDLSSIYSGTAVPTITYSGYPYDFASITGLSPSSPYINQSTFNFTYPISSLKYFNNGTIVSYSGISPTYTMTVTGTTTGPTSNIVTVSITPSFTGSLISNGNLWKIQAGTSGTYTATSSSRVLINTNGPSMIDLNNGTFSSDYYGPGTVISAYTNYIIVSLTQIPANWWVAPAGKAYTVTKAQSLNFTTTTVPSSYHILNIDNSYISPNERLICSACPNSFIKCISVATSNILISCNPSFSGTIPVGSTIYAPKKGDGLTVNGYVTKTNNFSNFIFNTISNPITTGYNIGDTLQLNTMSGSIITVTDLTSSTVTGTITPPYSGTLNYYNSILTKYTVSNSVDSTLYLFKTAVNPITNGFTSGYSVTCSAITTVGTTLSVFGAPNTSNLYISISPGFSGTIPTGSTLTWGSSTLSTVIVSQLWYITVASTTTLNGQGLLNIGPGLTVSRTAYWNTTPSSTVLELMTNGAGSGTIPVGSNVYAPSYQFRGSSYNITYTYTGTPSGTIIQGSVITAIDGNANYGGTVQYFNGTTLSFLQPFTNTPIQYSSFAIGTTSVSVAPANIATMGGATTTGSASYTAGSTTLTIPWSTAVTGINGYYISFIFLGFYGTVISSIANTSVTISVPASMRLATFTIPINTPFTRYLPTTIFTSVAQPTTFITTQLNTTSAPSTGTYYSTFFPTSVTLVQTWQYSGNFKEVLLQFPSTISSVSGFATHYLTKYFSTTTAATTVKLTPVSTAIFSTGPYFTSSVLGTGSITSISSPYIIVTLDTPYSGDFPYGNQTGTLTWGKTISTASTNDIFACVDTTAGITAGSIVNSSAFPSSIVTVVSVSSNPVGLTLNVSQSITGPPIGKFLGTFSINKNPITVGASSIYVFNVNSTTGLSGSSIKWVEKPSTSITITSTTSTSIYASLTPALTAAVSPWETLYTSLTSYTSGGGGYTGSPGTGLTGATSYVNPIVQNTVDYGAISNTAGYVTISIIDPAPITKTYSLVPFSQAGITTKNWSCISWSSQLGLFVATSWLASGLDFSSTPFMTISTDGINWNSNKITGLTVGGWKGNTWSPELGIFIAVNCINNSTPTSNSVAYSYNGITWNTVITGVTSKTWNSVCWSRELGMFVAVGLSSPYTMYSRNGINWNTNIGVAGTWLCVVWSSSLKLFLATGNSSPYIMYSSDGINWNSPNSPPTLTGQLAWSSTLGIFVAFSNNGSPYVYYSYNGITWLSANFMDTGSFVQGSILWINEMKMFIFAGYKVDLQSYYYYSNDGINWKNYSTYYNGSTYSLAWSPALNIIVAGGVSNQSAMSYAQIQNKF